MPCNYAASSREASFPAYFSTMKTLIRLIFCACPLAAIFAPLCHAGTTLTQKWALAPGGAEDYITTGDTERGIAFNPMTGNLLLATRAGGIRLIVLNPADGAKKHEMDTTGISGGNSGVIFNMVGVAADGAVYACNLVVATSGAPQAFKIYRWDNDLAGNPPTIAFEGDPSGVDGITGLSNAPNRWGDTLAVRGSGTDTQIIVGSGVTSTVVPPTTGVAACMFTTADGLAFTPHFLGSALEAGASKGLAFGAGDTFYSKANGGTKKIRRSSFDLTANTATVLNDFTVAPSAGTQIIPIALNLAANQWGTFETGGAGPEVVKIFDTSTVDAAPILLDQKTLPTDNPNTDAVGSAVIGDGRLYICDTSNGLVAYDITVTGAIVPPAITASPASRSVYSRAQTSTTFSVTATGTPPLAWRWLKDNVDIPNATSRDYTINPVTEASAGVYKCRVTNASQVPAESTPATLTVLAGVNTNFLTECWHLAPGSRPYLTTGDAERGMDFDPLRNRLYIASRTPKTIRIVSAVDGADMGPLLMDGVSGGVYDLNMVGVGGYSAIYACNLSNVDTGDGFKIYQWPDDAPDTVPAVLYEGNPINSRIGDTLDVRGSGQNTQVLCGARKTNQFVVFTKDTAGFLVANPVTVANAPASAFGLGITFGAGNTVWGKRSGDSLYLISYDLTAGTGSVVATYGAGVFPLDVSAIGVDPAAGLLAGIELANSDNVQLYNLPVPFPAPAPTSLEWLDQEFLMTDNDNVNGTGSVAVAAGKVFALNTNNGLVCYTATKTAPSSQPEITDVAQSNNNVVFKLKGIAGKTYRIEKSTDLSPAASWTPDGTVTQSAAEETVTRSIAPGTPRLYFRAREQ